MRLDRQRSTPPDVIEDGSWPAGSVPSAYGLNSRILRGWVYHWHSPQASRNWPGGWVRSRRAEFRDYLSHKLRASRLAQALPTINPTATEQQHASAAARMLADMAD